MSAGLLLPHHCILPLIGKSANRYTPGASFPRSDYSLTLPDVSQLLKVAEKTVDTMAQKCALPCFKIGGQGGLSVPISTRIERQELEATAIYNSRHLCRRR